MEPFSGDGVISGNLCGRPGSQVQLAACQNIARHVVANARFAGNARPSATLEADCCTCSIRAMGQPVFAGPPGGGGPPGFLGGAR